MKKIIIIGAGFGGLAALNIILKSKMDLEIVVIDKKDKSDFLPMLPDVIGRRINPDFLSFNLKKLADKKDLKFINGEVAKLDLDKNEVATATEKLNYDYLIIASGSETNFYGQQEIEKVAYKLDSVSDAKKLAKAINDSDNFIQKLTLEKTPQGRLKVDGNLKVNENCFVVGDAADFPYRGSHLRMAVQFAIFQGRLAAANIVRSINGAPLKKYRPIDFGYIIPMANNKSCGIVMGIYVTGFLATFLHYLMCIYRSFSLKNKLGILNNLILNR